MDKTLNIVNGDACIKMMKEAGIQGEFLPWRDFLHEGPIPAKLSLSELSKVRSEFIASYGLGTPKEILREFRERDTQLKSYQNYEKVTLWFEHDLYDQLQLLQILSWFFEQKAEHFNITLICTSNYLGDSSSKQIKKLLQYESKVSYEHMKTAHYAWSSFCESNPTKWVGLLSTKIDVLPYLKGAIYRLLEEYPNTKCGLSRSEFQTLAIISMGANNPIEIFNKYQAMEERRFMGDVVFWKILENFQNHGVIENLEGRLQVTSIGQKLLDGQIYWFNIKPFEKWIGGVKLTPDNIWCWNVEKKQLEHYYYSTVINSLIKIK